MSSADETFRLHRKAERKRSVEKRALRAASKSGARQRGASKLEARYETPARDTGVFGLVALVLLIVAVLGAVVPAWRAVRIQPQEALRSE